MRSPRGSITILLLDLLATALKYVPTFVWKIVFLVFDVVKYWVTKILQLIRHSPVRKLRRTLVLCQDYEAYEAVALKLDEESGYDSWRQNFTSRRYDYRLIHSRLMDLRRARLANDHERVASLLRSGFLRNFGGISSKRLYNKSYMGTKVLIEEYVAEVLDCLRFVSDEEQPSTLGTATFNQQKMDFFHEGKQTIGTTALILQGGSLFGICHVGVMRALFQHDLLPNVIAGSSVGAAAGALVCSLAPIELATHLDHLVEFIPSRKHHIDNVVENVLKNGFSEDVLIFIDYVRQVLGNMTFEEAHLVSDRILNIVVYPTDPAVPTLLNYLTAPNVTIISAVYCALGYNALGKEVEPEIKTEDGTIMPLRILNRTCHYMSPYYARTIDSKARHGDKQLQSQSPYTRLTELFNVNHFVVSLARPYLAPLIGLEFKHSKSTSWGIMKRIDRLVSLEFRYRVEMMNRIGLLLSVLKWALSDETAPLYAGNQIPIVPEMKTLFKDGKRIFDVGKYKENIPYWILVGEQSVWPLYPVLQARCAIEFTLDDYYNLFRNGH